MPHRFLAYFVTLLIAFALQAPTFAAGAAFPTGSRIGLEPPLDLKPSTRFSGFEDIDRKVAVTILDLPAAAYPGLDHAATSEQHGLNDVKRESFGFSSGTGLLVTGSINAGGVTVRKWILLATAPDKDLTALVSVEVPEAALAIYSDAIIRKALTSLTFRAAPIAEQLGMLPFKIGDSAGFRVMKVFPPSGAILIDGPGADMSAQPYVIVSIGRGAPERPDDRPRFARDLLASTPLHDILMQSADAMRINNAPGFEIRAQAQGPKGEPVMVVQWLRFAGDSYVRIVGVAGKQDWDALFTRFRTLRDGLDLR